MEKTTGRKDSCRSPTAENKLQEGSTGSDSVLGLLKSSWQQFDVAGSRLLVQLCNSLAGSQYDGVFKETVALLGPVFACGQSELVLRRLKEMESLMEQGTSAKTDATKSASHKQMILRCLLLFVKLQAEYHLLCSNLVSSAIEHITGAGDDHTDPELLQQVKSLDLKHFTLPSKVKKSSLQGLVSPKTPKGSLKASLFSFFERKNSPEEGNSSFYVDFEDNEVVGANSETEEVAKSHVISNNQSEAICKDHVTKRSESETLVDIGLDPGHGNTNSTKLLSPVSSRKNVTSVTGNGHVASQEELDSVINLLSGAGLGRGTMQTIPEQHNTSSLSLPGYQRSSLSPASSDLDDRSLTLRNKGQRRSEGSIDVSGFSHQGHNTWPNQHRASLPGGQLAPPQITYDFSMPPPSQPYNNNFRPNTLPPGGAGHFQAAYGMGFPDPKLNRTWPVNNLAGSGSVMDPINSSWSGGHDSDDLSDDSSCGEQYQTLSHIQYTDHRIDVYKDGQHSPYKKEERVGDVKHHSLEDLLDGRSNTWPQQLQPWSQSHLGVDLIGAQEQVPYHRPISMQMSDPLSGRNLWQNTGSEVPVTKQQQQHSQSVQGRIGQL